MKPSLGPVLILLLLALAACSASPPPETVEAPTPETPTAGPSPSATTSPPVSFPSIGLLPGQQAGDWRVAGLIENLSTQNLTDIRVAVSLLDSAGNTVAESEVPIIFSHLGPNESSPFSASFPGIGLASEAQARLSSYQIGSFQRAALHVEVETSQSTSRGGQAILTTVTNPGETPASILAMALLAQDDRGRPLGLALQAAGPSVLRGGESATILALLEIDAGATAYAPFVDAVDVELMPDPQPLELTAQPQLVLDNQGNPFALGAFLNSSQAPLLGAATLVVSYQGESISAAQVNTLVPLGPGEMRPFTAYEFPGLDSRLQGIHWSQQDLEIEARIDPQLAGAEAEPYALLDLSFRSFEAIGGFAFLQGVITNPHVNAVQNASVMATLYGSRGNLVTAGWLSAPEPLLAGQSYAFVLLIPLPAGASPRLSEFDAWAAGVFVTERVDPQD